MQLTVRLYANLVQYRPDSCSGRNFQVNLPDGSSIADLVNHLGIPEGEVRIVFVNHIISPPETTLKESDQVGIFSPIGGG